MHKPAAEDAVTSLHDLSAVDLIAGYRAKQFSPSEVLEEVLAHVAAWEPHIKALYLFDPEGARATAKASTDRWQKGEPDGHARRRAGHHQGQYRHQGPAGAAGRRQRQAGAGREGCAARRAVARGRRGHLLQDHDAGLRHAVVGPFELPSPHPQSLGPQQESRRLLFRRGRRGRGRLRPAASRHRHRRLGAAAGVLVRPGRAEAELRARSGRSALCRPRRRTDDPHRRRRRADDERAVEAGPPRRHEPAGRHEHQLEGARQVAAQAAHRPDARSPASGQPLEKRGARRRRQGRQGVRIRRRRRHRSRRHPDARDARRARQFLARADVGRSLEAAAGASAARRCPTSTNGPKPAQSCRASTSSGASTPPWRSAPRRRNCSATSTT